MNQIVKQYSSEVAKSGSPVRKEVGSALVKTSVGGAAIYGLAAITPFVTFLPMLLVILVLGGYLYVK